MLSMEELLQGKKLEDLSEEIQKNLPILLERVNKIRALWGKPLTVTSCVRSQADQERINPAAPKSKHLIGAAVDIFDKDGSLKSWIKDNESVLEDAELWMEDFSATPTWCHFQCLPPKSGKRFFIP